MAKVVQTGFDIDGVRVELIRAPVRRENYYWKGYQRYDIVEGSGVLGAPKEKTLYEIVIDGQLVGMASRPHGWGKQSFSIERLGVGYDTQVFPKSYHSRDEWLFEPEDIARTAARLRSEKYLGTSRSTLPTADEWAAWCQAEKRRAARDEREMQEKRKQWDRERAEARRLAEEQRMELLGGLQSIDERLGVQLTNYEASALRAAIHAALKSEH